jgi:hypothetical protein
MYLLTFCIGLLYTCSICDMQFQYKSWFQKHYTKHTNTGHVCIYCKKSYKGIDSLNRHKLYLHAKNKNKLNHQCTICQKKFKYLSSFLTH